MSTSAAKELLNRLRRVIAAPQARLLPVEVRELLHDVGMHLVNADEHAAQVERRVEALEAWRSESLEKKPDGKN